MRTTNELNKQKNVGIRRCIFQNKGITLIALIITIIVMLILVSVTIRMAINGGLFEKAGQAVGETENAINAEQQLIKNMMEDYFGNSTGGTGGGNTGGTGGGNTEETGGGSTGGGTQPEELKVGDYVNYTPDIGTYIVASGSKGSGTVSNQSFTTGTDLSWRVLSVNEETEEVEIVLATTGPTLKLSGADGYNHSVDILNDLCEKLYSKTKADGTKVAIGRSINVEDINAKTTYDYTTYTNYGNVKKTTLKKYPKIYAAELGSTSNGLNETTNMLKGSERGEVGTVNSSGVTEYSTYTSSKTALTLYSTHTYYYYQAEKYLDTSLGVNTAPTGLINIGDNFWLASRSVGAYSDLTEFSVRYVNSDGYVNSIYLFYSSDVVNYPDYAGRPVVSLTSNVSFKYDEANSTNSEVYWNVEF